MAQEVRSILFTEEEIHTAVTQLLMQRVRGLAPHQIARVQVNVRDGVVRTTVQFSKELNAKRVLDPNELMSAVLMYCRKSRIPLSNRAQKRLGVIDGCLSLTTSLNLSAMAPWVEGHTVFHALPDQKLLALHST